MHAVPSLDLDLDSLHSAFLGAMALAQELDLKFLEKGTANPYHGAMPPTLTQIRPFLCKGAICLGQKLNEKSLDSPCHFDLDSVRSLISMP